jgi:hypothetical protein
MLTMRTLFALTALIVLAATGSLSWEPLGSRCHAQEPTRGRTPEDPGSVHGLVLDQASRDPLPFAAVSLAPGPEGGPGMGTRMTDEEGFFAFDSVPSGIYFLEISLLGYGERRDTLRLAPGDDLDVLVTLAVAPLPMEPILVEVRRLYVPAYRAGFDERRRLRSGTFFTREDIESRGATHFSDLLRMVPGARVTYSSRWGQVVTLRGGCRPQLWVDGVRTVTALGMDDLLPPMDVDAVEVYHGAQTPAEFGGHSCGTIVVWTRRGEPGPAAGSFWKRLAVAAGFIALAILVAR